MRWFPVLLTLALVTRPIAAQSMMGARLGVSSLRTEQPAARTSSAPITGEFRGTHWLTGMLGGAAVGAVLGVYASDESRCDPASCNRTAWFFIPVVTMMLVGTVIGSLFKKH